jgi:pilus assembly protein Flp/PilA
LARQTGAGGIKTGAGAPAATDALGKNAGMILGRSIDKSTRGGHFIFEGRKESQMIQTLAARIQLAKMRAEDGQALVEYALIISLIAVVAIGALTVTGVNVNGILTSIANAL